MTGRVIFQWGSIYNVTPEIKHGSPDRHQSLLPQCHRGGWQENKKNPQKCHANVKYKRTDALPSSFITTRLPRCGSRAIPNIRGGVKKFIERRICCSSSPYISSLFFNIIPLNLNALSPFVFETVYAFEIKVFSLLLKPCLCCSL